MVAKEANRIHRDSIMEVFEPNVKAKVNSKCVEINENGVVVECDGKTEQLNADTVIYAIGMKSRTDTVEKLRSTRMYQRFFVVGDCNAPSRIKDATHGGYYAAMDII